MCYSDTDWELWTRQDAVNDLCSRAKYRAADPCECCLPKYMAKMRTLGKCDKHEKS